MAIAETYKKTVDALALANEPNKYLLTNIGLQHKCLFEVIIYPETLGTGWIAVKNAVQAAADLVIMRLNLYSINDIPLVGFEYERFGGILSVKDAIYPESFTCTFLEDNFGTVKGHFRKWLDLIASYSSYTREYYFNDNQDASKRTAIIIPQRADVLPVPEWIKIDGMKIKNITGIGYDHTSGENEIITCEFACDNIHLSLGAAQF